MTTLSIVIPAYNEELLIGQTIASVPDYIFRIYVVDDASTDGSAEAASELRRFILDLIRLGRTREGEPYLAVMDDVYIHLVTMDFPDALTGGLRRTTDMLRGVLERTRGDLTTTLQQEKLQKALREMESVMREK